MHRGLHALPLALIAALAACGSSSSGPAAGFECIGQALPTTAPPLINITGQVTSNVLSPTPVHGASVAAFRTGDTTTLASAMTNTTRQATTRSRSRAEERRSTATSV